MSHQLWAVFFFFFLLIDMNICYVSRGYLKFLLKYNFSFMCFVSFSKEIFHIMYQWYELFIY
jgi:hypothetical protein